MSPLYRKRNLDVSDLSDIKVLSLYETWLGFSETFKALVEDRTDIRDIEKLVPMKGCLQKAAAVVIASIETSSNNYKVAWKLLQEPYNNKKLIIESHAKSLMELQPVSKEF